MLQLSVAIRTGDTAVGEAVRRAAQRRKCPQRIDLSAATPDMTRHQDTTTSTLFCKLVACREAKTRPKPIQVVSWNHEFANDWQMAAVGRLARCEWTCGVGLLEMNINLLCLWYPSSGCHENVGRVLATFLSDDGYNHLISILYYKALPGRQGGRRWLVESHI